MSKSGPIQAGPEQTLTPGFVVLLCALSAVTAVSIDIMLPATGIIAAEFGVPEKMGSFLIGSYFLGYAVGMLFWGLASDAFGRRPVMLASMAGFTLAGLGCTLATSFDALIAMRVVQGLMAGSPVIARAVSRDIGSGAATTKLLALLMATSTVGPLLGPVLGSALLVLFDWRACFAALTIGGAVLWLICKFAYTETLREPRPNRFSLGFVASASRTLFGAREFLLGGAITTLTFAGYSAVLSLSAIMVADVYGLSPAAFAVIFALAACFTTAGSLSVRFFVGRLGLPRMTDLAVAVLGAAALFHFALLFMSPSLPVLWTGVCFYMLAFGAILPAGSATAMQPAGAMPGFAASLLGATMMMGGFFGGAIATAWYNADHLAISGAMAFFGSLTVAALLTGRLLAKR
jgi:DHA1 family bicyclomycin/chloramphenicol resistance-like MFS transporter